MSQKIRLINNLCCASINQHHTLDSLWIRKSMSCQHVAAQSNPDANILDNFEVVQDLLDLLSQLFHARILIIGGKSWSSIFLSWSIDVKYGKPLSDLLKKIDK